MEARRAASAQAETGAPVLSRIGRVKKATPPWSARLQSGATERSQSGTGLAQWSRQPRVVAVRQGGALLLSCAFLAAFLAGLVLWSVYSANAFSGYAPPDEYGQALISEPWVGEPELPNATTIDHGERRYELDRAMSESVMYPPMDPAYEEKIIASRAAAAEARRAEARATYPTIDPAYEDERMGTEGANAGADSTALR